MPPTRRKTRWLVLAIALGSAGGCKVDSYFDPSKTGRFEFTPTTIPILERIDVIERDRDPWAKATPVTPEDLKPAKLVYRIAPGDVLTVDVFELVSPGEVWSGTSRVNAAGDFRLPVPIGDVRAAGLTVQEFQERVYRLVDERVIPNPNVNVVVQEGAGFTYTIYGAVAGTGLYSLRRADFKVLDALAQAGGVPLATQNVYVIRRVALGEEPERPRVEPERRRPKDTEPLDIEDLIRQLDEPEGQAPPPSIPPEQPEPPQTQPPPAPTQPQEQPPIDIEDLIRQLERETESEEEPGGDDEPEIMPAALPQNTGPTIDIDELEAAPVPPAPRHPGRSAVGSKGETFIYDVQRDEWVPVHPDVFALPGGAGPALEPEGGDLFVERIIEIPYQRLKQGDGSQNPVIRPGDRIYVKEALQGVVYIDGEIVRPGVYSFPTTGKLTLSRLVAAAGGPGPLAIPTRVDLTRIVENNREATIRLNLEAIRQRTEPDIYLRPDDHIIIGTNFWATPLAVFRNGLRMTYGFGFLLDRNFGNDVFGAPPVNITGR